jgi:hypothetical protein
LALRAAPTPGSLCSNETIPDSPAPSAPPAAPAPGRLADVRKAEQAQPPADPGGSDDIVLPVLQKDAENWRAVLE